MSTGLTTNYSIPYPLSTDPVNVAGDIQQLAEKFDLNLTEWTQDTSAGMWTSGGTFSNGLQAPTYNDSTGKMSMTLAQDIRTSASPTFVGLTLTGDAAVNGGDITTSQTTFNLINTTATTLNVGGAATTLNIGNGSGQTNFAGHVNIATGKQYEINNVSVLTATTLGSSVVNSSLQTVGTITSGTWSATTIAVNKGGTGLTSYTAGDLVYASASTTLAKLSSVATGNVLISGGVGVAPSWGKVGLTTHVSGSLPISNGGTNSTATPTSGGVAYGNGTSYAFTASGSTDYVLTSNGTNPVWTANTGTGNVVRATSPTLTTPNIGNATASYLTVSGSLSGAEGGEITLGGASTYSGVIIDNYAGYYRIIQQSPTVLMLSVEDTDIKASANKLTLNSDVTTTASEDAFVEIERGTDPNVSIRWNESGDTWQFTNDGTTYYDIPTAAGGGGAGLEAVLMFAGM